LYNTSQHIYTLCNSILVISMWNSRVGRAAKWLLMAAAVCTLHSASVVSARFTARRTTVVVGRCFFSLFSLALCCMPCADVCCVPYAVLILNIVCCGLWDVCMQRSECWCCKLLNKKGEEKTKETLTHLYLSMQQ